MALPAAPGVKGAFAEPRSLQERRADHPLRACRTRREQGVIGRLPEIYNDPVSKSGELFDCLQTHSKLHAPPPEIVIPQK